MDFHYIILSLFAVVAYFIVTDESVAAAFYYVMNLVSTNIRRYWWWLLNNPKNPVVKYLIYRRSLRLAREIQKHFDEKDK